MEFFHNHCELAYFEDISVPPLREVLIPVCCGFAAIPHAMDGRRPDLEPIAA
jgi:hypothetical protein